MGSEDSAAATPPAERVGADVSDDDCGAKSVTDLIDDIERRSFRRNVTSRPPRKRFAPHAARSVSS